MTTIKKNYSPTFQKYLEETFYPAQNWALSEEGAYWIGTHAPSLRSLIDKMYDTALFAVYGITLNNRPLYIGQSIRAVRRMICHMHNIYLYPQNFGLKPSELENNTIKFELLETGVYSDSLRRETELHYINTMAPILQRCDGTDKCIPRGAARRTAVEPYLHKS